MKSKWMLLGAVAVLFAIPAAAQDVPKAEIFGEYSYLRFNPTIPQVRNLSLNGGGGGLTFNLNKYFGIKGEFMGYGSTNYTIPAGTPIPPAFGCTGCVTQVAITTQANAFTYLFGPQVNFRTSKFKVFGELLFGGANSNGYGNATHTIESDPGCVGCTVNKSTTQHPFTMAFGGGLDFNLSKSISIRPVEIDYVLTRFTNPFTSTNNQNNFRYVAGIVFNLGGK